MSLGIATLRTALDTAGIRTGLGAVRNETGRALGGIERQISTSLTSGVQRGIKAFGGWTLALTGIQALSGAAFLKVANDAANAADAVDKISIRTGIARGTIQEMQYVTDQAGGSMAGFEAAVRGVTQRLAGLEEGGDRQARAFERLGIAVRDGNGALRDREAITFEAIRGLQNMSNETDRMIAANEIFGRSASDLAPILAMTSDSFDEMRQQARDLGLVLDDQAVGSLVSYKDQLARIQAQFTAVTREVVVAFLPVLTKGIMPVLENSILPLLRRGAEYLTTLATRFFDAGVEGEDFRATIASVTGPLLGAGAAVLGVGQGFMAFSQYVLGATATAGAAIGAFIAQMENLSASSLADLLSLDPMRNVQAGLDLASGNWRPSNFDAGAIGREAATAGSAYFQRAEGYALAAGQSFALMANATETVAGALSNASQQTLSLTDTTRTLGTTGYSALGGPNGVAGGANTASEEVETLTEKFERLRGAITNLPDFANAALQAARVAQGIRNAEAAARIQADTQTAQAQAGYAPIPVPGVTVDVNLTRRWRQQMAINAANAEAAAIIRADTLIAQSLARRAALEEQLQANIATAREAQIDAAQASVIALDTEIARRQASVAAAREQMAVNEELRRQARAIMADTEAAQQAALRAIPIPGVTATYNPKNAAIPKANPAYFSGFDQGVSLRHIFNPSEDLDLRPAAEDFRETIASAAVGFASTLADSIISGDIGGAFRSLFSQGGDLITSLVGGPLGILIGGGIGLFGGILGSLFGGGQAEAERARQEARRAQGAPAISFTAQFYQTNNLGTQLQDPQTQAYLRGQFDQFLSAWATQIDLPGKLNTAVGHG